MVCSVAKGIVATVMSNLGLERYLQSQHLELVRAKVGDRYVLEEMRARGMNVGGEQSGHMILLDHATTGDGTIAALQVLAELVESGKKASELLHLFRSGSAVAEKCTLFGWQAAGEWHSQIGHCRGGKRVGGLRAPCHSARRAPSR
jgi:phosphomannomutase